MLPYLEAGKGSGAKCHFFCYWCPAEVGTLAKFYNCFKVMPSLIDNEIAGELKCVNSYRIVVEVETVSLEVRNGLLQAC